MSMISAFKIGSAVGGLLGKLKMFMILIAVIAVISYLQATRLDAKKAAAASIEIEQLVQISDRKDRQIELQSGLTKHYKNQSKNDRKIIRDVEASARAEINRVDSLQKKGGDRICAIDCRVP